MRSTFYHLQLITKHAIPSTHDVQLEEYILESQVHLVNNYNTIFKTYLQGKQLSYKKLGLWIFPKNHQGANKFSGKTIR